MYNEDISGTAPNNIWSLDQTLNAKRQTPGKGKTKERQKKQHYRTTQPPSNPLTKTIETAEVCSIPTKEDQQLCSLLLPPLGVVEPLYLGPGKGNESVDQPKMARVLLDVLYDEAEGTWQALSHHRADG